MSGKGGRSYADIASRVLGVDQQPQATSGFSVRGLLDALSSPAQQQTLLGYDPSQGAANNTAQGLLGAYNAVKTQPAPYDPQEFWRRANAGVKQDPRAWDNSLAIAGMVAPVGKPRVFYRGTNPESTARIRTGNDAWDSHLFAADNPDAARMYGKSIETIEASPDAKIAYEGSKEWVSHVGRWRKGESLLDYAARASETLKNAGFDAAWFERQGDVGTAIFNQSKFKRGIKSTPTGDN